MEVPESLKATCFREFCLEGGVFVYVPLPSPVMSVRSIARHFKHGQAGMDE